ncbi:MAG TPA: hypothetical protein VGK96_20060 [Candidatus Sulfotelmatobacter sp.]|jgi:hypothetical protein
MALIGDACVSTDDQNLALQLHARQLIAEGKETQGGTAALLGVGVAAVRQAEDFQAEDGEIHNGLGGRRSNAGNCFASERAI